MLASGLRTTDADPVQYFRNEFSADLRRVGEAGIDLRPSRLSVASFCPDYPQAQWYSGPAQAFGQLGEQRWFLGSLFASQLASQAGYSRRVEYYFGPPSILVGLLSSYWNIVHPGFLLLVLALYREAVAAADTTVGLGRILRAQVDEVRATEHRDGSWMLHAMAAGIGQSQIPTTLAPFVPGDFRLQHEVGAVQEWQACFA